MNGNGFWFEIGRIGARLLVVILLLVVGIIWMAVIDWKKRRAK